MSLFDQYASLFAPGGVGATPVAPGVAPIAAPVPAPAPVAQPNPLDIIKALGGLVHNDPLGDVARANANSNKMHTLDEWHAMFAPSHVQPVAAPIAPVAPITPPLGEPRSLATPYGTASVHWPSASMHPAVQNFLSLFGNSQLA